MAEICLSEHLVSPSAHLKLICIYIYRGNKVRRSPQSCGSDLNNLVQWKVILTMAEGLE